MIVQFAVNEKVSTISCADCRERRVKCDRQLPVCQRCQKRKVPCYYNFKGRQKLKKTHFIDSLPTLNINEVKQNELNNKGDRKALETVRRIASGDPRNDLKLSRKKLIEYIPSTKLGTPILLNTDLTSIGKKLLLALLTSDKSKIDELLSLPHTSSSIDFLVGKPSSPSSPQKATIINPDSSQFFLKLQGRLAELNLDGSQLSKLIQSDSFQNLFDPQFWTELIDIYINRVHIFYPIFDLREFQRNRNLAPNCLLSSMYYIGYLCRPNQDPFLCQYLKEYSVRQISKMYYGERLNLLYSMMIMASSIGYSNNITHCKFFLTQAIRIAYSLGLHKQIPRKRTRATKQCNDGLRANVWNILICYDITGNSFFGMDSFIPEVYYRNSEYSPTCVSSGIISNNGYIPLNLSYLHEFKLPREKVPNQSMFWYQKRSPSSSPDTNNPQDDHYNSIIDEVQPKCLYLFRYIIEKFVLPISYHIRKISMPSSDNDFLNPETLSNQIKLVNMSLDSAYIFGLKHFSGLSYNYKGDQLAPTIITPFVWGFVLMLKSFSIIVNALRPHCNLNASSPLPPNQLKNLLVSSKQLAHITSLYPPNFVSFRYIYIIRAATILFQEYPYLPLSAQPELRNSLKVIYEQIYLSSNNYAPFKDLLPKLKNLGLKLGFDISSEIE